MSVGSFALFPVYEHVNVLTLMDDDKIHLFTYFFNVFQRDGVQP